MDKDKIRKLIDDEKPAFDFAQMLLTVIAWWSLLIFLGSVFYTKGISIGFWFIIPVFVVAALFGLVLVARLNFLVETISAEIMAGANGSPRWLRWPIIAVASIMPMACAWVVVWALMFARFPL
ncbi:MAG: hypothetical protein J0H60_08340 [Rhizobiales bacterium]|nr:hypothetical protein [Hyphomicrobiales bacterium]